MILTLSSERVRNTVFTDERGLPVFRTDTPFRIGLRTTTIYRQNANQSGSETADPVQVMGSIDWHIIGSSIFTIDGKTLESNVFLPGSSGIIEGKRRFTGPGDRPYRWDMHFRDVALSVDDASNAEIARYHRATIGLGGGRSAYLEIAPEAEHMLGLVILTFVYVEKLRRDKERRRTAAATGGGH